MRVLIADDHADLVDGMALIVEHLGHDAIRAYDSADALLLCNEHEPHAVLLDLRMPGASGADVCRAIRGTDWGKRACVAALTAWETDVDRARAGNAGFDAFFLKPLDSKILADWIRKVAENRTSASA